MLFVVFVLCFFVLFVFVFLVIHLQGKASKEEMEAAQAAYGRSKQKGVAAQLHVGFLAQCSPPINVKIVLSRSGCSNVVL